MSGDMEKLIDEFAARIDQDPKNPTVRNTIAREFRRLSIAPSQPERKRYVEYRIRQEIDTALPSIVSSAVEEMDEQLLRAEDKGAVPVKDTKHFVLKLREQIYENLNKQLLPVDQMEKIVLGAVFSEMNWRDCVAEKFRE